MMIPQLPTNEVERLHAVRRYESSMKRQRVQHQHLTQVIAEAFDVPMAFITLIDINQQRFNACHGVQLPPIDRHLSLCAHAVLSEDVTVVQNTRRDARFSGNPFVQGEPNIRFYAGAPLKTRQGHAIGTLVIADAEPRQLIRGHRALLEEFANMIMDDLHKEQPASARAQPLEAL